MHKTVVTKPHQRGKSINVTGKHGTHPDPLGGYNHSMLVNREKSRYGVFVGTPTTGLIRMEWHIARMGQTIPCNWGISGMISWLPSSSPLNFLVADAQNIIVHQFMQENADYLMLLEQDNVLASDTFYRLNQYIRSRQVPIVSGLYFTKSYPAEPMVYRGRSNGFFEDWKIGDKVWCDGVPTGCLLIDRSILEVMYWESEEYQIGPNTARRVFNTPSNNWHDPAKNGWFANSGTSDLEWCSRIMTTGVFERAGWKKYAKMDYPFLIDTNIFSYHIDDNGQTFPTVEELEHWKRKARSGNGSKQYATTVTGVSSRNNAKNGRRQRGNRSKGV